MVTVNISKNVNEDISEKNKCSKIIKDKLGLSTATLEINYRVYYAESLVH